MKREIDLTENNAFSSNINTQSLNYFQKRRRKRIPWINSEMSSDLLDISYNNDNINVRYSKSNYNNSLIINDLASTLNLYTTNDIDDYVSINNNYFKYFYRQSDKIDTNNFRIGHVKYIKRKNYVQENIINKKYVKNAICYECNKTIKIKPWSKSNSITCPKCSLEKKNEHVNIKKMPLVKRIIKRWKKPDWRYYHMFESENYSIEGIMFCVPCISSVINPSITIPNSYQGLALYEFMDYYDSELKNYKKISVYKKGDSKRELRRREEPWQPHGRISQEYDNLFNNLDWRDMLAKRVGIYKELSKVEVVKLNQDFNGAFLNDMVNQLWKSHQYQVDNF